MSSPNDQLDERAILARIDDFNRQQTFALLSPPAGPVVREYRHACGARFRFTGASEADIDAQVAAYARQYPDLAEWWGVTPRQQPANGMAKKRRHASRRA
jgi:hypothetical protein